MLAVVVGFALSMAAEGPVPPPVRPRWIDATRNPQFPDEDRCVNVRGMRKDAAGLVWFQQTACKTRTEISEDAVDCSTMKAFWRAKDGSLQENIYKKESPYGVMLGFVCAMP